MGDKNYPMCDSLATIYNQSIKEFSEWCNCVPCPDYNCLTKETPVTSFHIPYADAEPMVSRLFPGGHHELQQYLMEVKDGILDFMVGAADNTWEYTYHQRIGDQLDWVYEELKRNPFSRRAVVQIRQPEDMTSEHPACLQQLQFFIRFGLLNMVAIMRSNDLINATFMNAFAFINGIQVPMADRLGIGVGSYTHIANSLHVYEKDFDKLDNYYKQLQERDVEDTVYHYKGFYDELMEAEIPSIMAMVEEQKGKYGIK